MFKVGVTVTPSLYRLRTRYQTKCSNDKTTPFVFDVKLLGGRLVVVADVTNKKVKLFSLEVRMSMLRNDACIYNYMIKSNKSDLV